MSKPSLEDILQQMKAWHIEATAWRNDGYVQDGYKEKLHTLHARITEIMANAPVHPIPVETEALFEEGTLDPEEISYRPRPVDNKDD